MSTRRYDRKNSDEESGGEASSKLSQGKLLIERILAPRAHYEDSGSGTYEPGQSEGDQPALICEQIAMLAKLAVPGGIVADVWSFLRIPVLAGP